MTRTTRGAATSSKPVGLTAVVAATSLALALFGCNGDVERVPEPYLPTSAHEAYGHSLEAAGLDDTALGRAWRAAASEALERPVEIALPFRESGWFDAGRAGAMGYRFAVEGGRRIDVRVDVRAEGEGDPRLFMDLFRLTEEADQQAVHVATGPAREPRLEIEPLRDARYVLRVQPELLRELRYTVTVHSGPQLGFPVEGLDTGAIQSGFGAPRDAGRRRHHGVDIFARRGTPVLAATDGVVRRVGVTEVGGTVVWLRDERRRYNLYYAHLESHLPALRRGQRVHRGQVLGYVGNTGNARTTPPHLHFGVYARGPVDPDPFLRLAGGEPASVTAGLEHLGRWARTRDLVTVVRPSPTARPDGLDRLAPRAPLRVHGATAGWLRVELPSGVRGYVAADSLEPASEPLHEARVTAGGAALHRPDPGGLELHRIDAGAAIPVLGTWQGFLMVPTPGGRPGWIPGAEDPASR